MMCESIVKCLIVFLFLLTMSKLNLLDRQICRPMLDNSYRRGQDNQAMMSVSIFAAWRPQKLDLGLLSHQFVWQADKCYGCLPKMAHGVMKESWQQLLPGQCGTDSDTTGKVALQRVRSHVRYENAWKINLSSWRISGLAVVESIPKTVSKHIIVILFRHWTVVSDGPNRVYWDIGLSMVPENVPPHWVELATIAGHIQFTYTLDVACWLSSAVSRGSKMHKSVGRSQALNTKELLLSWRSWQTCST